MRVLAVVFDMDGVLVDSEPLWHEAEIEAFAEVGVRLTASDCLQTMGLRCNEVVSHWYRLTPWSGTSQEEVRQRILEGVARRVRERAQPLPGVREALGAVRERGLRCALASSSPMSLIDSVVDALGLRGCFDSLHTADDVARGKPHPAVYEAALAALGVAPHTALAVEDSVNGLISCLAAGMTAVAIPAPDQRDDPRFAIADHLLDSLAELPGLLERLT